MYLEKDSVFETATNISPNNRMHADSKKRRSFLALLFAAGDAKRYAPRSEVIHQHHFFLRHLPRSWPRFPNTLANGYKHRDGVPSR